MKPNDDESVSNFRQISSDLYLLISIFTQKRRRLQMDVESRRLIMFCLEGLNKRLADNNVHRNRNAIKQKIQAFAYENMFILQSLRCIKILMSARCTTISIGPYVSLKHRLYFRLLTNTSCQEINKMVVGSLPKLLLNTYNQKREFIPFTTINNC